MTVLHRRERLGSTGIGDGVAIPHGKDAICSRVTVAVGRSLAGCDFAALDGKKCHIFCLLLAPESVAAGHLSLLAYFAKIFKSNEFRKRFMDAADADAIWRLINSTWRD